MSEPEIEPTFGGNFRAGFSAMLPLWTGLIPFGLAYALSARTAGLSALDTQLMSVIVLAGSAQFSAAGLFGLGATGASVVLTTFVINLRHLLYTLTLGQRLELSWPQKLLAAHLTTDEAFGVTIASGNVTYPFFLGTATSLFAAWNASTLAGTLLSAAVPDPAALGIDFVFPLAFLALLIPLLKRWTEVGVAALAGVSALLLTGVINSGLTIFLVGTLGALLGAWWTRPRARAERERA